MFDIDLIIASIFMFILFVRQLSILKEANKINYAPLILTIGVLSAIVHFAIHPESTELVLLLRESILALLISLFLYIVLYIMHQNSGAENSKAHDIFSKELYTQVTQLKESVDALDNKINARTEEEKKSQMELMMKFTQDIKSLDAIKINQAKFLEKFDEMNHLHKNVSKGFEHFTEVQLPELDNIVHKHIDILRIAEQDHFNKLKVVLENAVESRTDIVEDMEELKQNIQDMKNISTTVANTITKKTIEGLSGVTTSFEKQILSLKSHTEGIQTSLYEGENTLDEIKQKSEIIMKQMVLSSNKMNEVQEQNNGLHNIYSTIKELMSEMEAIKADYVKSQAQLSVISREFQSAENEQIDIMRVQIETLSETLSKKIDDSLEKLHEHYHNTNEDITKSFQELSNKVKLQKGYNTKLNSVQSTE